MPWTNLVTMTHFESGRLLCIADIAMNAFLLTAFLLQPRVVSGCLRVESCLEQNEDGGTEKAAI